MASDRTLLASAIRSSQTVVASPMSHPYENIDTVELGPSVDLGDERALSLTYSWQWNADSGRMTCQVLLECSNDQNVWMDFGGTVRDGGAFGIVDCAREPVGARSIGLTSPGRYVRAKHRICLSDSHTKGSVTSALTARST